MALEREVDEIVVVCDENNLPSVMSACSDFRQASRYPS
jgi:hypothetical protein